MKYRVETCECDDSHEYKEKLAEALEKGTSRGWTLIHQTDFQGVNEEGWDWTCAVYNYTYVLTWQLPED